MDNELIFSQFDDIEEKVGFLIEVCQMLNSENSELRDKITDLEGKISELTETELSNSEQKKVIRNRLQTLIQRLNSINEFPQ